jgi:hypothetical protein
MNSRPARPIPAPIPAFAPVLRAVLDGGTLSAMVGEVEVGGVAEGEIEDETLVLVDDVLLDEVMLDNVLLDDVLLVEAEDEGFTAAGFMKKEEDDICCSPLQSPW